jgi:hypothetical protein
MSQAKRASAGRAARLAAHWFASFGGERAVEGQKLNYLRMKIYNYYFEALLITS